MNCRNLWSIAFIATLIVLTNPASAATDADIEVEGGRPLYALRMQQREWTPFSARVRNNSEKDKRVGIMVSLRPPGATQSSDFIREFNLPAGAKREIRLPVNLDVPDAIYKSLIKPASNEDKITFADGNEIILQRQRGQLSYQVRAFDAVSSQEYPASPNFAMLVAPGDSNIIVLDNSPYEPEVSETYNEYGLPRVYGEESGRPHPDDMTAFSRNAAPAFGVNDQNTAQGLTLNLQDFPADSRLLNPARLIITGNLRPVDRKLDHGAGLSPAQEQAITEYVQAGGVLLVSPATDPVTYRNAFWQSMLPVRIKGTRQLSPEMAEPLAEYYERPLTGQLEGADPYGFAANIRIVEALPGDGEVILASDNTVLLAKKHIGLGQVWFTALPIGALKHWSAVPLLLKDIITSSSAHSLPGLAPAKSRQIAADSLAATVGVPAPSRQGVAILLLGFLAVSTVVFIYCRAKGRQELAWPLMLFFSAFSMSLAFLMGHISRQSIGFMQGIVATTQLSPGADEGLTTWHSGFMSSVTRRGDITWTDGSLVSRFNPKEEDATVSLASDARIVWAKDTRVRNINLPARELWAAQGVTTTHLAEPIDIQLYADNTGVHGTIKSGIPLEMAALRINQAVFPLGKLAAGEEISLDNFSYAINPRDGWSYNVVHDDQQLRANWLNRLCFATYRQAVSGYDTIASFNLSPLFVGWKTTMSEGAELIVSDGGKELPSLRGHHLIAVPVPKIQAKKGFIHIPGAFLGMSFASGIAHQSFGMYNNHGPGWLEDSQSAIINIQLNLPSGLEKLVVDNVVFKADIELIGLEARWSLRNPKARSEVLTEGKWSGGEHARQMAIALPAGLVPSINLQLASPANDISTQKAQKHWRINYLYLDVNGNIE